MTKLADILQEEVLEEINTLLADADSEAEAVLSEAREKGSARLAAHRRKTEAWVRLATQRAQSAAALALSTARMQARGEAIARIRQEALEELHAAGRRPDYGKVLEALAEEAVKAMETVEAVTVHPDDEGRLRAWAEAKGIELLTDPDLHLGVRVLAEGGKRWVENSLPQRLDRAWDTLAARVAQLLWE